MSNKLYVTSSSKQLKITNLSGMQKQRTLLEISGSHQSRFRSERRKCCWKVDYIRPRQANIGLHSRDDNGGA